MSDTHPDMRHLRAEIERLTAENRDLRSGEYLLRVIEEREALRKQVSQPTFQQHVRGDGSLKNALKMTGCENEENLIDMANVGNSLMERIDSLVSVPGPYHRWSPADDPAEIVFDLVNDLDEMREENAKLREALEQIAGLTGQFAVPFPDGQEGYPAFAVMTARAALATEGKTNG